MLQLYLLIELTLKNLTEAEKVALVNGNSMADDINRPCQRAAGTKNWRRNNFFFSLSV